MQKIKYIALLFCLPLFTQCELGYEDFNASEGSADFTNFVAIGDSYTAGYTDGALGAKGQKSSFSYILSQQLKYVGSTGFNQPLVESESSIGTTEIEPGVMNSYFQLKVTQAGIQPIPGAGDMSIFAERLYDASNQFQNFGVPGAKSFHLLADGYALLNPFFARFASSNTTSVMKDALASSPSFVSLWVGGNDVLTYALEGGEHDSITKPEAFTYYVSAIAQMLFSGNVKGVIGNIPDINDIPYFNYILADGFLPLVIEDESAPYGIRQLKEGEKVLLSASTYLQLGYGQSPEKPLSAKYVLDLQEVKKIKDAVVEYNKTIKGICEQYGLAYVDLNALLKKAGTTGYLIDGNLYTTKFVSGGVFSLDGIHVTGKGAAIIANEFINAINNTYESNIPHADVNSYDAVIFP